MDDVPAVEADDIELDVPAEPDATAAAAEAAAAAADAIIASC